MYSILLIHCVIHFEVFIIIYQTRNSYHLVYFLILIGLLSYNLVEACMWSAGALVLIS